MYTRTAQISVLLLGLLYTLLIVFLRKTVADRIGVMDHPGAQGHKAHKESTPLVGGIAALPPAILALIYGLATGEFGRAADSAMLALASVTAASFIVGLFDDRSHIGALARLAICGLIFCTAMMMRPEYVVSFLTFQTIGIEIPLGVFAIAFSVFSLLCFQNAVNMADGRDGLVGGISIIWLVALLSFGHHPSNLGVLTLLIGLIIVLIANLQGKLFLGDAGTYGIGAFIGMTTIWIHQSFIGLMTTDVVTMFIIPVLDMCRLFATRLVKGKSPFSADHDHLHHHLDRAVGWHNGRWIYYAIVAIPIAGFRIFSLNSLYALLLAVLLYGLALGLILWSDIADRRT